MVSLVQPVTVCAAAVIICSFVLVLVYDIAKKWRKEHKIKTRNGDDEGEHTSMDLRAMISINLLLMLMHQLLTFANSVLPSISTECVLITKICMLTYHISRCLLYLIFARRIQVIFCDTVFALKTTHFLILYTTILLYSVPYIFYLNWSILDVHTSLNNNRQCVMRYKSDTLSSFGFLSIAILDIFISVYCFLLFICPLVRLIAQQDDKQISFKLYQLVIKYCILYSSSICSCISFYLFSYFLPFGYNYSVIDTFLNGLILILLHPIHNTLYKSICCACHSFCALLCNAPKKSQAMIIRQHNLHAINIMQQKSETPGDTLNLQMNENATPAVMAKSPSVPTLEVAVSIRDMMKQRALQRFSSDRSLSDEQDAQRPESGEGENSKHGQIAHGNDAVNGFGDEHEDYNVSSSLQTMHTNVANQTPASSSASCLDGNAAIKGSEDEDDVILDACTMHRNLNDEGLTETAMAPVEDVQMPASLSQQARQQTVDAVVDIIMEEMEHDGDFFGSFHFGSFGSTQSDGMVSVSKIELEKARSNTLKLINYESIRL
mmetsp:Transcript_61723/g.98357  ORF Transcript_61723/g.98357 Transcript_61723/m.98357 type:complete len:548 (-) Transcript_61723:157-1800(-)